MAFWKQFHFSPSRAQRLRKAGISVSFWAIAELATFQFFNQFFSSEDYTVMCYLYSCATLPNFTAEQTWSCMWQGAEKPPALSSQKFLHATTAQVRFCSFWLGKSQWNFGGKLWNRAVRIMAYNSSIKTNTSHFWVELSAAFTEEADLCVQQRNHFKHNQRN